MSFTAFCISAEDLPHITKEEIEQVRKQFEGYPEFSDSVLGYGFLPLVQDAIINGKALEDVMQNPPAQREGNDTHIFCDFAWGGSGDENVVTRRITNVIKIEATFHCGHLFSTAKDSSPGLVDRFEETFLRMGLSPVDSHLISGDEGGGGKLVIDALESRSWFLNRVNNGFPASDPEHYASTGAEMWYEFGKLVTSRAVILPNDKTLKSQLLNRKRKRNDKGKLAVETKEEMRLRGVNSPDRADAVVGCALPVGGLSPSGIMSWARAVPVGSHQPLLG